MSWVLLWSRKQNALHIEPIDRMLSINRECYTDDTPMDYIPLYIGTQDEVDAAANACRKTLEARKVGKVVETV